MLTVTPSGVDAIYSNDEEAAQALDELQAFIRLGSLRRAVLDDQLEQARDQERQIRLFLRPVSGPQPIGALLGASAGYG